jgi:hypothetical protein
VKELTTDANLYKQIMQQIWDKVVITLGPITTAVILKKVISKTQTQYPFMKQLKVSEEGVYFNHLKINNKKKLEEGFESLINNLFDILANLTGDILIREIKRELQL